MLQEGVVEGEAAWADLLKPRYRRMMLLAAGLPLLQQLSGINSVVYFHFLHCEFSSLALRVKVPAWCCYQIQT